MAIDTDRSYVGDLLYRHPSARARWPGEDLLTEATAAILRRVPVLDDGSERVVWIEIKDWAPESGSNQLLKYWEALQECAHPHRQLVYLTRSGEPAGGAPAVTPYKWRDIAAFVEV